MNRGDLEWVNGEVIAYAWLVDYHVDFHHVEEGQSC